MPPPTLELKPTNGVVERAVLVETVPPQHFEHDMRQGSHVMVERTKIEWAQSIVERFDLTERERKLFKELSNG